jgi:hypothetical protein
MASTFSCLEEDEPCGFEDAGSETAAFVAAGDFELVRTVLLARRVVLQEEDLRLDFRGVDLVAAIWLSSKINDSIMCWHRPDPAV